MPVLTHQTASEATVDLTGPAARWTADRDELIVTRVSSVVVGRECTDCSAVKSASALAKEFVDPGEKRRTRRLCRPCARSQSATRAARA